LNVAGDLITARRCEGRQASLSMDAHTIPLEQTSAVQREDAARILIDALAHMPSAWHDLDAARQEVASFLADSDRMAIAAIEGDRLRGWIGALHHYAHAWELHPLVVDPAHHGRGFGTALVATLEQRAQASRIDTIWLGTDDDFGGTSLHGADLYPDVLGHLRRITPRSKHPYTFYQRLGFAIVGVLPDVNGRGRHDILMAKRVEPILGDRK
jgi:aminoglycoside 6'-N-acetyltransferase I